MQRVLGLVLTAWAGSLWTVCGVVAPSVFALLSDRHLAGQLAGHFFRVETWIGVALGSVALFLLSRRAGSATRYDYALVLATALAPLVSEVALRPLMESARAAGEMQRFGALHGVSALLFGVACITSLLLVWRVSAPPAAGVKAG